MAKPKFTDEDDALLSKVLINKLNTEGYDTLSAREGLSAFEEAKSSGADIAGSETLINDITNGKINLSFSPYDALS